MGKTFQKTRHHLTTKNGISKESFGYSNANPIFGSWQGATKSVVNWVLTSSIIQNIHQATTEGATFQSTDGEIEVRQSTVGFVDDNNNCVSQLRGQGSIVEKL